MSNSTIPQERMAHQIEEEGANKRPRRRQRCGPVALYKASVVTPKPTTTSDIANDAVILKIKKCLDRGNHPNTLEHEAKAALHLASRWMARYNVSQAQIFAQEEASDHVKHAGQCDVLINRVDGDRSKPVRIQSHVDVLCHAIMTFFDCKYFSAARGQSVMVSFFGIKANATAAADAFEMVFNLVANWALSHKGNGPRKSYCLGLSEELLNMATQEKRDMMAQVRRMENAARSSKAQRSAERQERLSSLLAPGNVIHRRPQSSEISQSQKGDDNDSASGPIDDSNDEGDSFEPTFKIEDEDDNELNIFDDLDKTIEKLIKEEPRSPHDDELSDSDLHTSGQGFDIPNAQYLPNSSAVGWTSETQLTVFQHTAEAIANEHIRSKGLRLRSARKADRQICYWDAYDQGKHDGRRIDVRSRIKRIEDRAVSE